MYKNFMGPMVMERSAAAAMAQAFQSSDLAQLDLFKPKPITLRIEGQAVVVGARRGPQAASGGGSDYGGYTIMNGVAIIALVGPVFKGGAGYGYCDQDEIRSSLQMALTDRAVTGIMFYVDSPGGSVAGSRELCADVFTANKVKPVVGFTEGLCASAAFWAIAGARSIFATETSFIGSIGVITSVMDASKAYADQGLKVTNFKTGSLKDVGDPSQPLTAKGTDYMQAITNDLGAMFFADVARGRNISESAVRGMQAGVFLGADAKRNGLIDAVTSFDVAWSQLRSAADPKYRQSASIRQNVHVRRMMAEMES